MNKYEKEAIEILQGFCTDDCLNNDIARTIVKLIDKQQKEIEELKSEFAINTEIHKRDLKIKELKEINECLHQTDKELFVSKDKIRKLKELVHKTLDDNGITRGYQLTIDNYFKELLEE